MSVRTHLVAVAGPPPRIEVRNAAGSISVEAVEDAAQIEVRVDPLDDAAEELLDRVEIGASDAEQADSPTGSGSSTPSSGCCALLPSPSGHRALAPPRGSPCLGRRRADRAVRRPRTHRRRGDVVAGRAPTCASAPRR